MAQKWSYPVLPLAIASALLIFITFQPMTRPASAKVGAPAPTFQLADMDGKLVSLSQYRGRTVLLDFWATWCDSCQEEMPQLETAYRRHRDKGFTVLAASMDHQGRSAIAPFAAKYKLTYPILLSDGKTATAYGVFGLPTAYLIDNGGVIVQRYVGPIDAQTLENDILTQLQK